MKLYFWIVVVLIALAGCLMVLKWMWMGIGLMSVSVLLTIMAVFKGHLQEYNKKSRQQIK